MYYNNAIACCYESKHCHKMMGQICNAKEIGKKIISMAVYCWVVGRRYIDGWTLLSFGRWLYCHA